MPTTGDSRNVPFRLAHSLLLSRFLSPSAPILKGAEGQLAGWAVALNETPDSAIDRLKSTNLLVPFAPSTPEAVSQALSNLFGVAQLKTMLKPRGLKISGRKDELIARLVKADFHVLASEIKALGLYQCSDEGKQLASLFEERKQQAYVASIIAINAKDYVRAFQEYQRIEDDLGFLKSQFEAPPNSELIELLMTVRPRILARCSDAVLARLRIAMALQCVAGRHVPKNLLKELDTGTHLDADTSARMIYFLARHTQDMRSWKQLGITHVKHFATSDSCSVCANLNAREWRIDQAPELPYAECTDAYGCRCLYQPILNF